MFCTPQLNTGIIAFLIQKEGKETTAYLHSWHPAYLFSSSRKQAQNGSVSQAQQTMCMKGDFQQIFWQKHGPIYFLSTRTLWLSQIMCCFTMAYPLLSDFSCLLVSFSFHLFHVLFNKTHWHAPPCCTTSLCSKKSEKEVSKVNKLKLGQSFRASAKHIFTCSVKQVQWFFFPSKAKFPAMGCHDFL